MKNIRILHIVGGDLNGGAARGAYWLHLGLKELGVDSNIFTNSTSILDDDNIIYLKKSFKNKMISSLGYRLDKFLLKLYPKREKKIFSTGLLGIDIKKINEYHDADIVQLHWINGSFVNIKHLKKIKKPLIWTIRDMWPLTGGCHYAFGCNQFQTGCGNCKQLNSKSNYDLSRVVLNRKKDSVPKKTKIIGISNWITSEAKKSELFKNYDVRTIPNNINTKDFFYVDNNDAKDKLKLKTKKKIVLVGAASLKSYIKGFNKFIEALKRLDKSKYFLCFFGNTDVNLINNLGFEYRNFGFLNDSITLRFVYNCADVFVAPSLMESFGKTIAESMSCGTPVVCFDATGPIDIVSHKINGYRAIPYESEDLATGIEWVIDHNLNGELSKNATCDVRSKFDSKVIAKSYLELYNELMEAY